MKKIKQLQTVSESGVFPFKTNKNIVRETAQATQFLKIEPAKEAEIVDGVKNNSNRTTFCNDISNNGHKVKIHTESKLVYSIKYRVLETKSVKYLRIFASNDVDEEDQNICAGFYKYCNDHYNMIINKDLQFVFNSYINMVNIERKKAKKEEYMLLSKGTTYGI